MQTCTLMLCIPACLSDAQLTAEVGQLKQQNKSLQAENAELSKAATADNERAVSAATAAATAQVEQTKVALQAAQQQQAELKGLLAEAVSLLEAEREGRQKASTELKRCGELQEYCSVHCSRLAFMSPQRVKASLYVWCGLDSLVLCLLGPYVSLQTFPNNEHTAPPSMCTVLKLPWLLCVHCSLGQALHEKQAALQEIIRTSSAAAVASSQQLDEANAAQEALQGQVNTLQASQVGGWLCRQRCSA